MNETQCVHGIWSFRFMYFLAENPIVAKINYGVSLDLHSTYASSQADWLTLLTDNRS